MPLKRGSDFVERLYRKEGSVTDEVLVLKDSSRNIIHRRSTYKFYDGATLKETLVRTFGVQNINPTTLTSVSHVMTGWYTANVGGSEVTFPRLATDSDASYYARWAIKTYTVQYYTYWDDMPAEDPFLVEHGATARYPVVDTNFGVGYEFSHLSDRTNVTSNRILYIYRKLKTYKLTIGSKTGVGSITVRLNSAGGTILSNNADITHGDKLYITATAASGYAAPTVTGSPVTVSGNVTAANYVTAGAKLPTETIVTPTLYVMGVDDGMAAAYIGFFHDKSGVTFPDFQFDLWIYSDQGIGSHTGQKINLRSSHQIIGYEFPGSPADFQSLEVMWPTQTKVVGGVTYKINSGYFSA